MAIYAYADETIFMINAKKNEFALGCGILISKTKINQSVIAEALRNLKSDIECNHKKDYKTLQNGFFHASEDSKNGHSYICHSINKNVLGVFDYTYKRKIEQEDLSKKNFEEGIFERCLSKSTIELFLTTEEVNLFIENREKLNETNILKWKNKLYHLYEGASYNLPSYKTFFPKINVFLKDKREPGLQIVDFLIWASNRSVKSNPDNKWLNRIKYKTCHSYEEDDNFNREKHYLNISPNLAYKLDDYPQKFEAPSEWEDFLNAYINIEKYLITIQESDFSEKNMHLYKDLKEISDKLKINDYHISIEDIEQIGRVFIRLFDTMPIYFNISDNDKDSWSLLFHMKYLASMFTRREPNIHFDRTRGEIRRWRYKIKTQTPYEFQKLITAS